MNKDLLELYSDYLLSSFSHTTATGLSAMTGGEVSHDKVSRFLSEKDLDSRTLWRLVKPVVRELEKVADEDEMIGALIIDDTIEEKPYTDESELVCWHYDHSQGTQRQGNKPHQRALAARRDFRTRGFRASQEERMGFQREEGAVAKEES
jgi:hypothetical protein